MPPSQHVKECKEEVINIFKLLRKGTLFLKWISFKMILASTWVQETELLWITRLNLHAGKTEYHQYQQ